MRHSEVVIRFELLLGTAVAGVPVDGGLDDAGVGGVDVVLVQGYGVEQRVLRFDRPAAEGGSVDLADGGQGAVRTGVDVRLEKQYLFQDKFSK